MAQTVTGYIYERFKSKPIEIMAVLLGIASTSLISYNIIVTMREKKKRAELDEIQKEITILQYKKLLKEMDEEQ